jgi:electron transfer flavoprotein alpha subunit
MRDVVIFVEHVQGQPRRVSFEIATKAKELATALGGSVHALVLGKNASAAAEALKAYPIDKIHVSEDPDIDAFFIDPSVDYLEAVATAVGPSLILVPYTMIGRDLGSRLAVRLDAGQTADVTDVVVADGKVSCVSPKLGGTLVTTCAFKGDYGIAAIRPNSFKAAPSAGAGEIVQLEKPAGKTYRMKVDEEVVEAAGEIGVEEASTVVSGGRGVGGPDPFKASPARSSTRSGCGRPRRSSPSTRTAPYRSVSSRISSSSGISSRSCRNSRIKYARSTRSPEKESI